MNKITRTDASGGWLFISRRSPKTLFFFGIFSLVKAQLSVDCQLPMIFVSVAKLGLTYVEEISGAWFAELSEPVPAGEVDQCRFEQLETVSPLTHFFTFNFSSADCKTLMKPQVKSDLQKMIELAGLHTVNTSPKVVIFSRRFHSRRTRYKLYCCSFKILSM